MQIAYVNVFVRDLAAATAFYRDKLGLQLQFSSAEHGYASFSAGGVRLGVALPGGDQPELVGRHTGIGFEVPDLATEHTRLSGLGVRFTMPPTRQPWGGFMAMIADPDGNVFYLDQAAAAHGKPVQSAYIGNPSPVRDDRPRRGSLPRRQDPSPPGRTGVRPCGSG